MPILPAVLAFSPLACRPAAEPPPSVIVLVLDGLRVDESFADADSELTGEPAHDTIPRIWSELAPQGTVVRALHDLGTTLTAPAHAAMLSGVRQSLANFSVDYQPYLYRPARPSLFEELRLQSGLERDAVELTGNTTLISPMAWSLMPGYGNPVGANWFFAAAEPGSDRPASEDARVLGALKHALQDHHVALALANFKDVDRKGHYGADGDYVQAVRDLDGPIADFWSWLQQQEGYAGRTVLVVTSDHGRHRGGDPQDQRWRSHGDASAGDREVPLLMVGPGVVPGQVIEGPWAEEDLAPTIASLLGIELPWAEGMPIDELLSHAPESPVRRGVQAVAASGDFLVESRFSDDPAHRVGVWWGDLMLSDPGAWVAEAPGVVAAGDQAWACWRELHADAEWMPWVPRCAHLLAGGAVEPLPGPEEQVGPFWRPFMGFSGGRPWMAWAHNPDAIAELGQDGDVAPRLAELEAGGWVVTADPAPEWRYPTGVSAVELDGAFLLAFSASPAGNRAREERRVHVQRFVPGEGVEPSVELDLDGPRPEGSEAWRIEAPVLRSSGDGVELLALALADDQRFVLRARSEDGGAGFGPAEIVAGDAGIYPEPGPVWAGDRAAWVARAGAFAQVCVEGSFCEPLPSSRVAGMAWDGRALQVLASIDGAWQVVEVVP